MDHADHVPGTREDCPECVALAYEPGWYKAMRADRVVPPRPDQIVVPEAGDADIDVVVSEAPTPPITIVEGAADDAERKPR